MRLHDCVFYSVTPVIPTKSWKCPCCPCHLPVSLIQAFLEVSGQAQPRESPDAQAQIQRGHVRQAARSRYREMNWRPTSMTPASGYRISPPALTSMHPQHPAPASPPCLSKMPGAVLDYLAAPINPPGQAADAGC